MSTWTDYIDDERRFARPLDRWEGNAAVGPTAQWQRHLDEIDLIKHLHVGGWSVPEIARYLGKERVQIVRALETT